MDVRLINQLKCPYCKRFLTVWADMSKVTLHTEELEDYKQQPKELELHKELKKMHEHNLKIDKKSDKK